MHPQVMWKYIVSIYYWNTSSSHVEIYCKYTLLKYIRQSSVEIYCKYILLKYILKSCMEIYCKYMLWLMVSQIIFLIWPVLVVYCQIFWIFYSQFFLANMAKSDLVAERLLLSEHLMLLNGENRMDLLIKLDVEVHCCMRIKVFAWGTTILLVL